MSGIPFPIDFAVEGTAVSQQGAPDSRERWKVRIAERARSRLRELTEWAWLDDRRLGVTILYFLNERMQGDIDNIVKPILDALSGVLYPDDRVVERVLVQKFEPEAGRDVPVWSQQMAIALVAPSPTVYIRVEDHLAWRLEP
jgi:Holliday junction resolvase RusA-like endonuclease